MTFCTSQRYPVTLWRVAESLALPDPLLHGFAQQVWILAPYLRPPSPEPPALSGSPFNGHVWASTPQERQHGKSPSAGYMPYARNWREQGMPKSWPNRAFGKPDGRVIIVGPFHQTATNSCINLPTLSRNIGQGAGRDQRSSRKPHRQGIQIGQPSPQHCCSPSPVRLSNQLVALW